MWLSFGKAWCGCRLRRMVCSEQLKFVFCLQVFYGVDFGGTNLRAVRVELDGHGSSVQSQSRRNIRTDVNVKLPKGLLDRNATATMLFDAIAQEVRDKICVFWRQRTSFVALGVYGLVGFEPVRFGAANWVWKFG